MERKASKSTAFTSFRGMLGEVEDSCWAESCERRSSNSFDPRRSKDRWRQYRVFWTYVDVSNSVRTPGQDARDTHTKRDTSVIKVQVSVRYGWRISRLEEHRTRVL
jgi:hypothetical protein